ncbi:MAG TPA: nuclease-related domain-containing protein [bacterium]|nr:MAG: Nuclease-related domain protein [Parcubacteria group bacterium ADurb.Bin192]HPN14595.1 nuclease-related domain-containing protein [bacterium]
MAQVSKTTNSWLDDKKRKATFRFDVIQIILIALGVLYLVYNFINYKNLWIVFISSFVYLLILAIFIRLAILYGRKNIRPYYLGHEAEVEIFEILEGLPDSYWVMRDPINSNTGNVDFAVIGPTGIFAIEVKSSGVSLDVKWGRLAYNGLSKYYGKDFVKQTKNGAFKISQCLKACGLDYFVQPILVFTHARGLRLGKNKLDNTYIVRKEWLNDIILEHKGAFVNESKISKLLVCLAH